MTNIFKIASGLIFVVATIVVMFAIGSLGRMGFEKVLNVDNCYYATKPVQVGGTTPEVDKEYEANCRRDTENNDRRQVADSAAMLLASLPVAYFFYRRVKE